MYTRLHRNRQEGEAETLKAAPRLPVEVAAQSSGLAVPLCRLGSSADLFPSASLRLPACPARAWLRFVALPPVWLGSPSRASLAVVVAPRPVWLWPGPSVCVLRFWNQFEFVPVI